MNKWVRKSLVALFTIATFGLVTPPAALTADENYPNTSTHSQESSESTLANVVVSESFEEQKHEDFAHIILEQAKLQSFEKFGGKIGPQIEEEFNAVIFPKMEEEIHTFLQEEEHFDQLVLSNNPSGGRGEKIFHLYDEKTGQDLLRFHVRIDHPPQEGYWFNFHYHTYHDHFSTHYELGSIFWDYNTPPKWMTH
ncbi:YpjP family protein [Bacillus kexueae]|uniref:YpjP family protein n=1 Tax=Aeribacillus kexueae TaxID=2078952 RepID=UPI001FAEA59B|nr:YpjP family protein [Bacillus kexueae]